MDQENHALSSSHPEIGYLESFSAIVDDLGQWSDVDDENDAEFTSLFEKESLCSLFNFQDKSWVE